MGGGGPGFTIQDSQSDEPKGDTPRLSSRIQENPDLADQECEDDDRCEEACRDIYKDTDSQKDCHNLTIGQVAAISDVFYALLESDPDGLGDIDDDDLKDYLEIGLDGWRDKVIEKQSEKEDRNEIFVNTLNWIVDQEKDVVPTLQREDRDNEILKEVFLGHCHIDVGVSAKSCSNNTDGVAISNNSTPFRFDYALGEIYYTSTNTKVASIDESRNKELFLALVTGGKAFFERAAGNRRFDAFVLGNNLLEQACTSRDNTSVHQCIAAFYCYLQNQINDCGTSDSANSCVRINWNGIEAAIRRDVDLKNCNDFEAI